MEDIYALSDHEIAKRIGEKIRTIRLKGNITQAELAKRAQISLSTLKKQEAGEVGSFDSLLRVLRTLWLLESLEELVREEELSPIEYYDFVNRAHKQQRKRATGKQKKTQEKLIW